MIAAALMATAASADDISNNLDASVDAVAEIMPLNVGGANGTTQLFVTREMETAKTAATSPAVQRSASRSHRVTPL
jgi:hypothetical protein